MSDEKNRAVAPALVLEGGGFRGMFTAGVLDVLQERGLTGFSSIWGLSAGAVNASNFRSRQIGRTMRDILAFRDDRRFMSLWSFATTGDMAGADFMYDEVQNRLDPCDVATFNASETPLWVVVSDVTFGTPDYLRVGRFPEDLERVRASASLPTVSRIVEIDGHRYLDGGTTDSIPYAAALGLDGAPEVAGRPAAERALVVLTQDRGFVREQGGLGRAACPALAPLRPLSLLPGGAAHPRRALQRPARAPLGARAHGALPRDRARGARDRGVLHARW